MGASTTDRRRFGNAATPAAGDGARATLGAGPTDRDDVLTPSPTGDGAAGSTTPTEPPRIGGYELAAGTMVGEYRIEQKLGEGGMGLVYAATHPLIGKRAAIKVLKPALCVDELALGRFVDEARAVNRIGHPNIVDVFAFGDLPDGRLYYVMEWLSGESLRQRMDRGVLTPDEIFAYAGGIATALEAAHDAGIIHRDLKPDNVFLMTVKGGRPMVKLLDFGIAKLSGVDQYRAQSTATGSMVGTPQYMAPEQARGYQIDARVDLYSLGVMLFELIAGRPPFVADNAMDMVAQHLTDLAPRLASLAPDTPAILDDLVAKMLSKEAADRPSLAMVRTVLERAEQLIAAQAGRRVDAKRLTEPPLERGSRALSIEMPRAATPVPVPAATQRRRVVIGAIAVAVAAVVAIVVVRAARSDRAVPPASTPVGVPATGTPDARRAEPPGDARPVDARPVDARIVDAAPRPDAARDARRAPRPDARRAGARPDAPPDANKTMGNSIFIPKPPKGPR